MKMNLAQPGRRRPFPPIRRIINGLNLRDLQEQRRWLRDSRGWNKEWKGTYTAVQNDCLQTLALRHGANVAFIPAGTLRQNQTYNARLRRRVLNGPAILNEADFRLHRGASDHVIIPMYQPSHTYGIFIDFPNRIVTCIDACVGNTSTRICTNLLRGFLTREYGFVFQFNMVNPDPQAGVVNGDCGPFVINWLENRLNGNGAAINSVSLRDLKYRLALHLEGANMNIVFP
jgi:hypothetical protein